MWINPAYTPSDPLATAKAVVDGHPLGVIIAREPFGIAHLPLLWREDERGEPVLLWHMPVADPTSRAVAAGSPVTIVFPGPTSYVTPNWYDGLGLPTYNYVPVHVSGRATRLDEGALREHLLDLIRDHEETHSPEPSPWRIDAPATALLDEILPEVIGFSLPVADLEVKAKLSQNRSETDSKTVRTKLADGGPDQREISAMMRALCPHAAH